MTEMKSIAKENRISSWWIDFSLSVVAIFAFVIVQKILGINSFITNDQIVMQDIVSGRFTGNCDAHLIYIMYPLGLILKGLYLLVPRVQWYSCLMLLTYPICLAFSVYFFANGIKKMWLKATGTIALVVLFISMNEWFISINEYTVDAGIFFATGLFCVLLSYNQTSNKVVAMLCFVMSFWLRKQLFFMLLPLLVLTLIYAIIRCEFKRCLTFFITLCAIVLMSFAIEKVAYLGDSWSNYRQYNDARTQLFDFYGFPSYENESEVLQLNDVSENEYRALMSNLGLVQSVDAEILKEIGDRSKELYQSNNPIWPLSTQVKYLIRTNFHALKISLSGRLIMVLFGLQAVLTLVLLFFSKKIWPNIVFVATSFLAVIYVLCVIAGMTVFGRFPDRISYPLYYTVVLFLAASLRFTLQMFSKIDIKRKDLFLQICSAGSMAAVIAVCSIMFFAGLSDIKEYSDFWGKQIAEQAKVNEYCSENLGNVYFIDSSISNYGSNYMFKNRYEIQDNYLALNYWTQGSILQEKRYDRVLSKHPYKALIEDENVLYICPKEADVSWLSSLYSDSYDNVLIKETYFIVSELRELVVYSVSKE